MLVTEKEYHSIQDYKMNNRRCVYCKYYVEKLFEFINDKHCTAKGINLRIFNKAKKCELYSVNMIDYCIGNESDILHENIEKRLKIQSDRLKLMEIRQEEKRTDYYNRYC